MKSGNLNFWNALGHSRPVTGLLYLYMFKTFVPLLSGHASYPYIQHGPGRIKIIVDKILSGKWLQI
jgi:hypothetical protein